MEVIDNRIHKISGSSRNPIEGEWRSMTIASNHDRNQDSELGKKSIYRGKKAVPIPLCDNSKDGEDVIMHLNGIRAERERSSKILKNPNQKTKERERKGGILTFNIRETCMKIIEVRE
ncbi:unnamed protein product [Dovyalis caffra]|uniref:Uncharacterized protein n=1 Tax=Dovyalis caffra TaxID=77055 RepID=A0AAV1RYA0_9ROSI|nr:unnamed protein product [Dovyalis caffra]